jgi:ribokinase
VATSESKQLVPGFKVKPVDTTAAGDTFNGALAVALAEGKSLNEAVRFANAAGAISVTRMGAQPSAPTRAEIEKLLGGKKAAPPGRAPSRRVGTSTNGSARKKGHVAKKV